MRTLPAATLALLLLPTLASCTRDSDAALSRWVSEVDTIGDTIVVHTVSGSVLGGPVDLVPEVQIGALEGSDEEMFGSVAGLAVDAAGNFYVYDRQVPALRKYGPDGKFIATFGRKGGGPGEYGDSDGGLAVLRDGRIVLRDPGNARYTVYQPDGTPNTTWLGQGGYYTSTPLFVDTAGFLYRMAYRDVDRRDGTPITTRRPTLLVRVSAEGTLGDTLQVYDYSYESTPLVASRTVGENTSTSITSVPFTPTFQWTFSPLGWFVTAITDRYAIDQHRPDGKVLRITRDHDPVPVTAAEREDAEMRTTTNLRRVDPDWKWNGPSIPDVKPALRSMFADQDGRIWVLLSMPSEEVEVTAADDAQQTRLLPGRVPPPRFVQPVVYDVFEADGRYFGQVRAPKGFSLNPQPVARGNYVWAVFRDSLDVNYVARFRIGAATPSTATGN